MNKALWWVATIFWILAAVPAAMAAAMSFMMFDAPGSMESPLTVALFWSVLTSPVFCLLGAGVPWLLRAKPYGMWLFLLPFVDIAAAVVIVALVEYSCGGSFVCR
ncbi:MAG: hypothetical protein JO192_03340 [Candidatus Eremiobacteraeota bacterium]|nr:hypothetical protein [Candidatus Eremiobacteraeota bacterium]MBV8723256.1 hypothetical protein [Candidatus Eremiobacteraeota bacterium]